MEHDSQREAYYVHVWIRGIHPMLWRRFLVRSDSTLADLHVSGMRRRSMGRAPGGLWGTASLSGPARGCAGDQEKPGARLDCFCFGAHGGIQRDTGPGGHSRARSAPPPSLAPGFSRSPS
jgi:hypothetical protein